MSLYLVLAENEDWRSSSISYIAKESIIEADSPEEAITKKIQNMLDHEYKGMTIGEDYDKSEVKDFINQHCEDAIAIEIANSDITNMSSKKIKKSLIAYV